MRCARHWRRCIPVPIRSSVSRMSTTSRQPVAPARVGKEVASDARHGRRHRQSLAASALAPSPPCPEVQAVRRSQNHPPSTGRLPGSRWGSSLARGQRGLPAAADRSDAHVRAAARWHSCRPIPGQILGIVEDGRAARLRRRPVDQAHAHRSEHAGSAQVEAGVIERDLIVLDA
jgi:hypothetical protein